MTASTRRGPGAADPGLEQRCVDGAACVEVVARMRAADRARLLDVDDDVRAAAVAELRWRAALIAEAHRRGQP
jgi:hypothetical protein